MAENLWFRRLDGSGVQRFSLDECTFRRAIKPQVPIWVKVDPEEPENATIFGMEPCERKVLPDGTVCKRLPFTTVANQRLWREYLLIRSGQWILCRAALSPSHGMVFEEVSPSHVRRDLEQCGIPIPVELGDSQASLSTQGNRLDEQEPKREEPEILPRWDSASCQLCYNDTLCRSFEDRRAPAQYRIIEAFQAAKWSKMPIQAPFSEKQLRDNIRSLNRGLEPGSPIEFEPVGPSRMAWKLRQLR